jgi:hypothetical protein
MGGMDLVRTYVTDVLNTHKVETVYDIFSPNYVDHDPFFATHRPDGIFHEAKHRADVLKLGHFLSRPEVDVKFNLEELFESNDRIAYRLYGEGTVKVDSVRKTGEAPHAVDTRVFRSVADALEMEHDAGKSMLHSIYQCTGIFLVENEMLVARWGVATLT